MNQDEMGQEFLTRADELKRQHQELLINCEADGVLRGDIQTALDRIAGKLENLAAIADGNAGDWAALLATQFRAIEPSVENLLQVCRPENQSVLQGLRQSYEEAIAAGSSASSQNALAALSAKVDELAALRADGQQRRAPRLAQIRERASALRNRLQLITTSGGAQ